MTKLSNQLAQDYPQFAFAPSKRAYWSASEQTIFYTNDNLQTLHELGHALLGHTSYYQDIELLSIERAAWAKAQELAPHYGLVIDNDTVEDALDSYRCWLHERSCCPRCNQTGLQSVTDLSYHCPTCGAKWLASDGKCSQLKRRLIN